MQRLLVSLLLLCAVPAAAERQRAVRPTEPDVEIVRDVTYGVVGSRELKLDIVRPKGFFTAAPAVVFIHGGGWSTGDKAGGTRMLEPLARRGYVGVTVNYRLSGEAIFPAQIEDVKCAIRYLRANAVSLGVDPDRIGVWGSSAGAHLAAMLGTTADVDSWNVSGGWSGFSSRVQAVVDWFGPSNFNTIGSQALLCSRFDHDAAGSPESLLIGCAIPSCRDLAAAASPITYVTPDDAPTLLMHGTNDCTAPPRQSVEFHERLRAAGVDATLMLLNGAGHGGPAFAAQTDTVIAFFDRTLRR
jgi:acetyl esterase/lipase